MQDLRQLNKKIEEIKRILQQRDLRFFLLFITTFLLVLFSIYLLLHEEKKMKVATSYENAKKIETGATLYEINCRSCHGNRGGGVGQLGPALNDAAFFQQRLQEVGWLSTLESYIQSTITHGRMIATRPFYAGDGSSSVMAPWHQNYGGSLCSDQITALTRFILNWQKSASGEIELEALPAPTVQTGDSQSIARGKDVFAVHCASCHSFGSFQQSEKNRENAPALDSIAKISGKRVEGMDGISYIRESILIPEQYIVEDFAEEAKKNPCGAILTETELTALLSYLLQEQQ